MAIAPALGGADEPSKAQATQPTIRLSSPDNPATRFEVVGIRAAQLEAWKTKLHPDQWHRIFAVYVVNDTPAESSEPLALLGSYRVDEERLCFEPRFPLVRGVRYRAVFDPSESGAGFKPAATAGRRIVKEFTIPKLAASVPTVVAHVYPTRNKLPENQLKFYVHFSAPMRRGEAYEHIKLLNASGKAIDYPFLELGEELWDQEGKRFTLFFDPGRVKRGLKPREDLGPVLEAGKTYTLVISQAWRDAEGRTLDKPYRKTFQAVAMDEQSPEIKKWQITHPKADTREALSIQFPEPLDHAMLDRVIRVVDADDRRVAGKVAITDEETRWRFVPDQPWRHGTYYLDIDSTLEDLAGNSIGRPFEVDVFRPVERQVKTETVRLKFQVE